MITKTEWQMFLLLCDRHFDAPLKTWRLHTKLYKFGWNTFPNNAGMTICTDLNLCEFCFIYQSYIISQILDLIYWMVTIFIFDSVTVHTTNFVLSRNNNHDIDQTRSILGVYQGRGRTLGDAWHFLCIWIIQQKMTSHPVKKSSERQNQIWIWHNRSLCK